MRAPLLIALAAAGAAVEPPSADPLADLLGDEDVPLTLAVTGIAPGAGSSSAALSVSAASADRGLVRISSVVFDAAAGRASVALRPVANANGTTALFVRIADAGGAELALSCHLTLRPQPDPPQIGSSALVMASGLLEVAIDGFWSIDDPDQPDPATLRYRLRAAPAPAVGELLLAGAALAPGDTWTQADIAAGRLAFRLYALLAAYTPVYVPCDIDDGAATVSNCTYAIYVRGSDIPAAGITLPDAAATWVEGADPVAVCPTAAVQTTAGLVAVAVRDPAGRAGDRLTLATGILAGELMEADGIVHVVGHPDLSATVAGGADGAPLVIASGSLAWTAGTDSFAQLLLRAVRFANAGRDPGQGARPLEVALVGADGDLATAATAVAVVAVDDPPVVTTAGIGTVSGLPRTVRLMADDPDSADLRWSLVSAPDVADLALAADGTCTIRPRWIGAASAVVAVDDGVNPPQRRTIAVHVTGPDAVRPQPLAEPPAAAYAGEAWSFVLPWDAAVAVGADDDAPADLAIAALADDTVRISWAVPADAAAVRSFSLIATDAVTMASGRLPVLLVVHPRPGAVR